MNIELDEVVGLDVSDEALELAAGGAQGINFVLVTNNTCLWAGCTVSYC